MGWLLIIIVYLGPLIDIFSLIDVEGFDPLVLQGSENLLRHHVIRTVIFEYNNIGNWVSYKLEDIVKTFDENGYDCFFEGGYFMANYR